MDSLLGHRGETEAVGGFSSVSPHVMVSCHVSVRLRVMHILQRFDRKHELSKSKETGRRSEVTCRNRGSLTAATSQKCTYCGARLEDD